MIELIKQYSVGAVFSDTDNLGFEFIMDKLSEGTIPDGTVVYSPYENLTPQDLAGAIDEQAEIFTTFAEQLSELGDES